MSHMAGAQVRILWNMFALCAGAFSVNYRQLARFFDDTYFCLTCISTRSSQLYQQVVPIVSPEGRVV